MSDCGGDDPVSEQLSPRILSLFLELEVAGGARLHPIERDIVEALKQRPCSSWCWAQLRLLEGLVLKAKGDMVGLDKFLAQR